MESPFHSGELAVQEREDLHAIVRHIGQDSPARAKSFSQELRDKTQPLAQHPHMRSLADPG